MSDLISYTDQELLGIPGEIKRTLATLGFAAVRPQATRWPRTH